MPDRPGRLWGYLVTARHVAERVAYGDFVIRLNAAGDRLRPDLAHVRAERAHRVSDIGGGERDGEQAAILGALQGEIAARSLPFGTEAGGLGCALPSVRMPATFRGRRTLALNLKRPPATTTQVYASLGRNTV